MIYCQILYLITKGIDCLVNANVFIELNYCCFVDITFSFIVKYITGKAKLETAVLILRGLLIAMLKKILNFLQNTPGISVNDEIRENINVANIIIIRTATY